VGCTTSTTAPRDADDVLAPYRCLQSHLNAQRMQQDVPPLRPWWRFW